MALHGPPIGDLLTAEEIRHHCLPFARSVACFLLTLHPVRGQEGQKLEGVDTLMDIMIFIKREIRNRAKFLRDDMQLQ